MMFVEFNGELWVRDERMKMLSYIIAYSLINKCAMLESQKAIEG